MSSSVTSFAITLIAAEIEHIIHQSSEDFDPEAHPELKKLPDPSKILIQRILGNQKSYQEIISRDVSKRESGSPLTIGKG